MMALSRLISALLIVAALGVRVPVALAEPDSAMADAWHVVESHGGARYRPTSEQYWWPARTGSRIPHGSIIATGNSGFLIIVRAGESITVDPNTRIDLPSEATGNQVRQATGDVRYRITRMPGRRFGVETPYLSLLVKGTVFEVAVDDRGAEVQVTDGRVRVDAARGQVVELDRGQSARIASGAQANLEFRPDPESPFVAAPSSRRSIAAAYSSDANGPATRDRRLAADQETTRPERVAAVNRAGSVSGREAGPGGRDPAGGTGSGMAVGIAEDGAWVDTPLAQVDAIPPERDTVIAERAPAHLESDTAPERSLLTPESEPQTTALAQSGDNSERDTGNQPVATADEPAEHAVGPTHRDIEASAGGGGTGDAVVWAMLVVLTVALWWRLRRSRHRRSAGHAAARRWPWQRSDLEPSGSGAGSANAETSSPSPVRRGL